jgi:pyridoxine 4-dehydrogenase
MTQQTELAGSFTLPNTSVTMNRMGYGAMQLAGPQAWTISIPATSMVPM